MKTKHIFSSAAIVALSIFVTSCLSDEIISSSENSTLTTFTGGSISGEDPTTRSSMCVEKLYEVDSSANGLIRTLAYLNSYGADTINAPVSFFWGKGDCIYVQDDNGNWNKSINNTARFDASFDFLLEGVYSGKDVYTVHYTGNNTATTSPTSVTIRKEQIRRGLSDGDTNDMGYNGDCAVGTATKQTDGKYKFTVKHKASYLRILPYTESGIIYSNYYMKRIKITSNTPIAGTYDLSDNGLINPKDTSTEIRFFCVYDYTPPRIAINYQYHHTRNFMVVIAPGTHTLTVEYTIANKTNINDTKTITKNYKTKVFNENTFYSVPVNLTL